MRNKLMLIPTLLVAAAFATGGQAEQSKYDPDALAKTVAPFIDELTIAVFHVDLARVDVDATFAKLKEMLDVKGDGDDELASTRATLGRIVTGFTKAGGTNLYVVVSLADMDREPMLMIVPLSAESDPKALRNLLLYGGPDAPAERPSRRQAVIIGGAMVAARPSQIRRLREMQTPHPRPALSQAFAAAGDTAAQILILPTDDNRRVVEEMLAEPFEQFTGRPLTVLTRGALWAAIGVDAPPKMRLRVVMQSKDPDAAKALGPAIPKLLKTLLVAASGGEEKAKAAWPDLDKSLQPLTPEVAKNRLALDLDDKKLSTLISDIVPPALRLARQQARRAVSAAKIRGILMACLLYANDNKQQWPPDLEALFKAALISDKRLLVNPARPADAVGYVYVRPRQPADKMKLASDVVLVYEKHDQWPAGGINVGFADGHVQLIADRARFQELLKKTTAAKKDN